MSLLTFSIGIVNAQSEINPIPQATDEWRSSITPYVWAPGLMATINNNNGSSSTADFSMNQVLSNLKSGAMGASEVHKGNWGIFTDVFFATLQNTGMLNAPDFDRNIRIADKITLQATVLNAAGTYTAFNNQNIYIDGLLGVRAAFATASAHLSDASTTSVNVSTTFNTITPFAGFKGRYRLAGSSWYIPFYADAGSRGGPTSMTWQAMLGVGKAITNTVDVSLTYRALYADLKGHNDVMKANLKGPQLAFTFGF